MKIESLNYEQLLKAKNLYNEVSVLGFLLNVNNSFRDKKITEEEKKYLLEASDKERHPLPSPRG